MDHATHLRLKRLLDVTISAVALLASAPVLIAIAIAIRVGSPGPIIFRQSRIGLNGEVFTILKFRTMVPDAETQGTGLTCYEDDPRVTRVGRVLRITSADELPQLLNVLKGEMSIVGPRPPVIDELGPYQSLPTETLKRFAMKPGITGLAQVNGRNDLGWDRKIHLDNTYISRFQQTGIREDFSILAMTTRAVLTCRGIHERQSDVA